MNVKIKVMNEKNKSLKCAKWLSKCVSFGWEKESIPALEKLWNDNHDEKGNLIKSAIPKQKVDDTEPPLLNLGFEIKFIKNELLPPNTAMVSKDIYEILKNNYQNK